MSVAISRAGDSISQPAIILSFNPEFAEAGVDLEGLILTISGNNFRPGSIVRWNNQDLSPISQSASEIKVQIPPAFLRKAAGNRIRIVGPSPEFIESAVSCFPTINLQIRSDASHIANDVANDSIAYTTGNNLATQTEHATTVGLPTSIAGTVVEVYNICPQSPPLAGLHCVSQQKVRFQIPPNSAVTSGRKIVQVISGSGDVSVGYPQISLVFPGLFSANKNGRGVAFKASTRTQERPWMSY